MRAAARMSCEVLKMRLATDGESLTNALAQARTTAPHGPSSGSAAIAATEPNAIDAASRDPRDPIESEMTSSRASPMRSTLLNE